MATAELHRGLARSLPIRLQRFFVHNPPTAVAGASSTTGGDAAPSASGAAQQKYKLNPFAPHKNPQTGRWHPPIYSLRQQAELVKLAREFQVEELLPFTIKSTTERNRKRAEQGLRVKGTGLGQRVKGHEWERTLKGRLDKRRQAMLEMPKMIQEWKLVSKLVRAHLSYVYANFAQAWSWSWMEEVAQMSTCHNLSHQFECVVHPQSAPFGTMHIRYMEWAGLTGGRATMYEYKRGQNHTHGSLVVVVMGFLLLRRAGAARAHPPSFSCSCKQSRSHVNTTKNSSSHPA